MVLVRREVATAQLAKEAPPRKTGNKDDEDAPPSRYGGCRWDFGERPV
jgi:hypothetical protein